MLRSGMGNKWPVRKIQEQRVGWERESERRERSERLWSGSREEIAGMLSIFRGIMRALLFRISFCLKEDFFFVWGRKRRR